MSTTESADDETVLQRLRKRVNGTDASDGDTEQEAEHGDKDMDDEDDEVEEEADEEMEQKREGDPDAYVDQLQGADSEEEMREIVMSIMEMSAEPEKDDESEMKGDETEGDDEVEQESEDEDIESMVEETVEEKLDETADEIIEQKLVEILEEEKSATEQKARTDSPAQGGTGDGGGPTLFSDEEGNE